MPRESPTPVAGRLRDAGDALPRAASTCRRRPSRPSNKGRRAAPRRDRRQGAPRGRRRLRWQHSAVLPSPAVLAPSLEFADDSPSRVRDDRKENIEKIADALELERKLLFQKRAFADAAAGSSGRVRPPGAVAARLQQAASAREEGRAAQHGCFMLAAIRDNGEPILIAGRGMTMDMHVGIPPPPVKAADAETRLRTKTTAANSHDLLQRHDRGAAELMAMLRRVIIKMRLSGADAAALVDRILDQIDGRCEDRDARARRCRRLSIWMDSDDEATLGSAPPGVDEEDWAVLKKGLDSALFAVSASDSDDCAAAASSLLGKLRAAGPEVKCGGVGRVRGRPGPGRRRGAAGRPAAAAMPSAARRCRRARRSVPWTGSPRSRRWTSTGRSRRTSRTRQPGPSRSARLRGRAPPRLLAALLAGHGRVHPKFRPGRAQLVERRGGRRPGPGRQPRRLAVVDVAKAGCRAAAKRLRLVGA